MHFLKVGLIVMLIVAQFTGMPVEAASNNVVISQLQTAGNGTGTAGQEFVEIYNNSDNDIDVTSWYLTYSSASDATQSPLFRVVTADAQTTLWLKAKSYAMFVSPDYKTATGVMGDGTFSYANGMAATAGHVRLFNGSNVEIDKVAWGATTVTPPEVTAPAPQGGKALQRIGGSILQDTDNDANDFSLVTPVLHTTGLYEIITVIDVCPNIDGAQATIPPGMVQTSSGCFVDVCPNVDGLQTDIPLGETKDVNGNCVYDACVNIEGIQPSIPIGYESPDTLHCLVKSYELEITELLPNPAGDDTGNEYLEVYNPNDFPVDMSGYIFHVGSGFEKQYIAPGLIIPAGGYVVVTNAHVGFTLVNSQSRVKLIAPAGNIISETPLYLNPNDGESWALIDSEWSYTNQPTPGGANMVSTIDVSEEDGTGVTTPLPCAPGKYRHPLTNRCRNIETDVSVLSTCDADQYRNPETGRCRKVTTATTALCKEGQYRSEETNRCRNITTASTQKPCKDSQYRSEETGRCRNMAATSVPESAFAVQPVKDGAIAFVGWWALGGIGLLALGYAGWEWRNEILGVWGRTASFLSGKK